MRFLNIFCTILGLSGAAHAQTSGILSGINQNPVTLEQSLEAVTPGSVVILGENHGLATHRLQQLQIIEKIQEKGFRVSVGMEFFTYTHQAQVDGYLSGNLSEEAFLQAISWGGTPYDFYRTQVLAPLKSNGWTWALNAPRNLTGKIAREGLGALTSEEWNLLPPQFTLGRESYKQRFLALMPHLPNAEAGERYFAAQSAWDDTMAWRVSEILAAQPDQVLVIIVGDFHVAWGGGLPDRIRQRAPQVPVLTFSLLNTTSLSAAELAHEVSPDAQGEARAHYIWLSAAP